MEVDTTSFEQQVAFKNCGLKKFKGLRQGMPLSPLLSHLYLKDFDKNITSSGYSVVRYVDDILLVAGSRREAENAFDIAREFLSGLGLKLPEIGTDKTELFEPRQKFEFLGLEFQPIDGELSPIKVPTKIRSRIHERLTKAVDFSRLSSKEQEGAIFRYIQLLGSIDQGYRNHYKNCSNYRNLTRWIEDEKRSSINKFLSFASELHSQKSGASRFMSLL